MTSFGVNAAGMTDQGRIRRMNMDCFLVNRSLNLYAVADGIESAPTAKWRAGWRCSTWKK